MEARLGHDFANVRIHTGPRAAAAALSIGARAYTTGSHIVFGLDEYAPSRAAGRWLLAHELTHVVQQGSATRLPHSPAENGSTPAERSAPPSIQRASFTVGSLTINVNYSGLPGIPDAGLVAAVESRFVAFTGAADASAIHAALAALTASQQRWVLYALDLHQDNIASPRDDRLDRTVAVQRLIAHAPSAAHTFPGALGPPEEEALRASGWFEVALAGGLSAPGAADVTEIEKVLNPPASGGVGAPLNVPRFRARMPPAVRHLLAFVDPAAWPTTGTQSLPTLAGIGDDIMNEAKDFFAPVAHTARSSVFGLSPAFHISANIFSVTSMVPTPALRLSYLRNRATVVGWNTDVHPAFSDRNIFHEVNFDGGRATDRVEFENLVTTLEGDAAVAARVNRLIQHTGRQTGSGAATRIGLSTEFNATAMTECRARWQSIDTLCHEVMHALAHPDFEAESAAVDFGQVLLEGFPEVLGTQLFNDRIRPKAAATPAFKTRMESGLAGAPCPAPPAGTIGYGAAGSGAESIRSRVGNQRFRAAFFLGQKHLIGR